MSNVAQVFGLFFILSLVLVLSVVVLGEFEKGSTGTCQTLGNSVYNDAAVNGNGSVGVDLPYYVTGGLLLVNYSTAGTVYVNSCPFPVALTVSVPKTCFTYNNTISYIDSNITNTSVEYTMLGNCSYGLNEYNAIRTGGTWITGFLSLNNPVIWLCFGFVVVAIIKGGT